MEIPKKFQNLPKISPKELSQKFKSKEKIKGNTIRGKALETLHKAFFENVPVELEGCLIDGDLDFTKGPRVPLDQVEELSQERKDRLKNMDIEEMVAVKDHLNIGGSLINGNVLADKVIFYSATSFDSAILGDWASFNETLFNEGASFNGATLGKGASVWFATFGKESRFHGATFDEGACFEGAYFGDGARLHFARFGDGASFDSARFEKEAIFYAVHFGEGASFNGATLEKGASFEDACFGDGASFHRARFGDGASFHRARFGDGASFDSAILGDWASFNGATLGKGASFEGAYFGEGASFHLATFGDGVSFHRATFEGSAEFRGQKQRRDEEYEVVEEEIPIFEGRVNFQRVRLNAPEKVLFQHADLSQTLFLETLLDEVKFLDVHWAKRQWSKALYDEIAPELKGVRKNYAFIGHLYHQLKMNYQGQRAYFEASDFHYGEMEMAKNQHWENKEWYSWLITRAYKLFSGYGEKSGKAMLWAIGILLIPGVFYYLGEVKFGKPPEALQNLMDCFGKSLGYMTFRIYEMPNQKWAKVLAFTQAVLGPIQLALAALALRRKFRR